MVPTDQHRLIHQAIRDIWNAGLVEAADDLFARYYVNHGGLITDLVAGPEAIKISVVVLRMAFPGLHVTVGDLRTEGESTTIHWTAENRRLEASPAPVGASAARGQVTGVTRVRWAHGEIAESWTSWDAQPTNTVPGPHLAA